LAKKLRDEELPNQYIVVNGNKVSVEDYRKDPNKFNNLEMPEEYKKSIEDKFKNKINNKN